MNVSHLRPVICTDCGHQVPFGWINSTEGITCAAQDDKWGHRIPRALYDAFASDGQYSLSWTFNYGDSGETLDLLVEKRPGWLSEHEVREIHSSIVTNLCLGSRGARAGVYEFGYCRNFDVAFDRSGGKGLDSLKCTVTVAFDRTNEQA